MIIKKRQADRPMETLANVVIRYVFSASCKYCVPYAKKTKFNRNIVSNRSIVQVL